MEATRLYQAEVIAIIPGKQNRVTTFALREIADA